MALSRVKNWVSAEVLYASDLENEFNNVLNNGLALISPLTGNLDFSGFSLANLAVGAVGSPGAYFNGDTNTGVYQAVADSLDVAAGGVRVASFYTRTSAVNYLAFRPGVTGNTVTIEAAGSDTNIGIELVPKGTGYAVIGRGSSVGSAFRPSLVFRGDPALDSGLMQMTTGTVDLVAGGRRVVQASAFADATNYHLLTPSAAGNALRWEAAGGDTNVGLTIDTKGTGALTLGSADTSSVTVATAFGLASLGAGPAIANTPLANAIYAGMGIAAWVNFKGTSAASIYGSINITSVARTNTGEYTITFDRDFAATPYALAGMAYEDSSNGSIVAIDDAAGAMATGSCLIVTEIANSNAAVDSQIVSVLFAGVQ